MPWLIDYLTGLYILSGDWGKFILLAFFLVGLLILLLDLRGRSAVNKKKALRIFLTVVSGTAMFAIGIRGDRKAYRINR